MTMVAWLENSQNVGSAEVTSTDTLFILISSSGKTTDPNLI